MKKLFLSLLLAMPLVALGQAPIVRQWATTNGPTTTSNIVGRITTNVLNGATITNGVIKTGQTPQSQEVIRNADGTVSLKIDNDTSPGFQIVGGDLRLNAGSIWLNGSGFAYHGNGSGLTNVAGILFGTNSTDGTITNRNGGNVRLLASTDDLTAGAQITFWPKTINSVNASGSAQFLRFKSAFSNANYGGDFVFDHTVATNTFGDAEPDVIHTMSFNGRQGAVGGVKTNQSNWTDQNESCWQNGAGYSQLERWSSWGAPYTQWGTNAQWRAWGGDLVWTTADKQYYSSDYGFMVDTFNLGGSFSRLDTVANAYGCIIKSVNPNLGAKQIDLRGTLITYTNDANSGGVDIRGGNLWVKNGPGTRQIKFSIPSTIAYISGADSSSATPLVHTGWLYNQFTADTADIVPLEVKGAGSHNTNLFELKDSTGAIKASFSSNGTLRAFSGLNAGSSSQFTVDGSGNTTNVAGTRTWIHNSSGTSITNTSTLTGSTFADGQYKDYYNGAVTFLRDKTNGIETAYNYSSYTNLSTMAPNFNLGSSMITTNAAFTWLSPINVDATQMQTAVIFVTNSTASAVLVSLPASIHGQGTFYLTNVSVFTFMHYGNAFTNCTSLPLY